MKFLIILLILTGCETKFEQNGKYFPGEYRPELNIGNTSQLFISQSTLISGETTQVTVITKDIKDQFVTTGGAAISLSTQGEGSVNISPFTDNQDGSYLATVTAIKSGSTTLNLIANKKTTLVNISLNITPGNINLDKSEVFVSRTNFLVNEVAQVIFTPKDLNGNLVNNTSLSIYPTITEGTSFGSVGGFTYNQGNYISTLTASQEGTPSKLNLSVRNIGIVTSPYSISVLPTKPNYTKSTLSISKTSLKLGQTLSLSIYIKDVNGTLVNINNLPISLEIYNGTSVVSFSSVVKSGSFYTSTITAIQAGTFSKIRAKVDGEYIISEIASFQVVP